MNEMLFARRACEATSAAELLTFEAAAQRSNQFSPIETAITDIMRCAMRGQRVVQVTTTDRNDTLEIIGVPDALRAALTELFQLKTQQARGAWFLPESATIKARSLLFPALFREAPRYAYLLATEEKGTFPLATNPDALVVWSLLEQFADALLEPIFLRVEGSGLLSRDEFVARWTAIEERFMEMGLAVTQELRPLSWAGGWAGFSADAQVAAKAQLLEAISARLNIDVVRRYRAHVVRSLITQYYSKAKHGRARRRQVITKNHVRALAGFFGGDWLAFVRYLGEQPHDEERIATVLPEPKIIVSGKSRAAEVAAKRGIPVEEVQRILGAFWSDASANSPVLDRVAALADYWRHFDAAHARQAPGMHSLWGLVEDFGGVRLESNSDTSYQRALYRRVLPAELVMRIEGLWGTTTLAKWPDAIVSECSPHAMMAQALGPALTFWHGCALTAWFICEGPTSRTDVAGLADYHRRELAELAEAGCPVPVQLFEELMSVQLGPEIPIYSDDDRIDFGYGASIRLQVSRGSRRSGFERLRDVITRHRQQWAARHLDAYLRSRWETELKATARQYHLLTEDRGKPPTLRQFAKHAVQPARRWFGGDVSLLYASLGLKLAGGVRRSLCMPADRLAFATEVFVRLAGMPFEQSAAAWSAEPRERQAARQHRHDRLRRLAESSLTYVQLLEALGRPPTSKEFGWPAEPEPSEAHELGWETFAGVVEGALAQAANRACGCG